MKNNRNLSLKPVIEALIFSSPNPIPPQKIALITNESIKKVKEVLKELVSTYEKEDSALELVKIAGGYQIRTRSEYSDLIKQNLEVSVRKYSSAAIETLSIIAYKQPITRLEIESLRTVDSAYTIRTLLENELIKIVGRANDTPGRPNLYGTTEKFLEIFALNSLEDLPELADFQIS